jgi:hypothetical protein
MKIIMDVRHFLMIMVILCVGFAVAFSVAVPEVNPILWLVWMVNTGVYGYSELMSEENNHPTVPTQEWKHFGTLMLFEVLMLMVALILLNLLIAIMNSAYESVRLVATLEMMNEKSTIIIQIERLWLPMCIKWFKLDGDVLFPRWLHVLVPVGQVGGGAGAR